MYGFLCAILFRSNMGDSFRLLVLYVIAGSVIVIAWNYFIFGDVVLRWHRIWYILTVDGHRMMSPVFNLAIFGIGLLRSVVSPLLIVVRAVYGLE